jgi:hypothetical protein
MLATVLEKEDWWASDDEATWGRYVEYSIYPLIERQDREKNS